MLNSRSPLESPGIIYAFQAIATGDIEEQIAAALLIANTLDSTVSKCILRYLYSNRDQINSFVIKILERGLLSSSHILTIGDSYKRVTR